MLLPCHLFERTTVFSPIVPVQQFLHVSHALSRIPDSNIECPATDSSPFSPPFLRDTDSIVFRHTSIIS